MSETYNQKYYEANKTREKLRTKKYRKENPQKSKEWDKVKYEKHKEIIGARVRLYSEKNSEKIKEYQKAYRLKNKAKNKEYAKVYKAKNAEILSAAKAKYKRKNRKNLSNKERLKMQTCPLARLTRNMRTSISSRIAQGCTGKIRHLPYSMKQLEKHLESQFQAGMTWENYGRNGWNVDHIIPLRFKDTSGKYYWDQRELVNPKSETFQRAWALDNLQPLWESLNFKKNCFRKG